MTELGRPYDDLVDANQLAQIEAALPGGAATVLGMIKSDQEWEQKRITLQDTRDHNTRLLSIWLTIITVLVIAGLSTLIILEGHPAPGAILASSDLVGLATVLVNSWRRS